MSHTESLRRRLSVKLLIGIEVVLLTAVVLLILPLGLQMRQQIVSDLELRLRSIADTAALFLNGDQIGSLRTADDAKSIEFRNLRELLLRIRDANGLTADNIYTVFRDDRGQIRFGLMTHDTPFIGDAWARPPAILDAALEGRPVMTGLYEDENGQWVSTLTPIRDSGGRVVGVLDVNSRAEQYFNGYWMVVRLTVAAGLAVLALTSMVGWLLLNRVVARPMRAVYDGMLALSRSDFGHRIKLKTGDEFEQLGHTFNRLAKEMNAARRVQTSFNPTTLPRLEGYRIAALSDPCDATAGDYFDVFELPGNRIGVVVADVSGHGLGPSLIMASCRASLRALSRTESTPSHVVSRLDELMESDLVEGRFVTLIFGVLHAEGLFTFCNAGHAPALFVDEAGTVRQIAVHRAPLGVPWDPSMAGGDPAESTLRLAPGTRLVLASDGIVEAPDPLRQQFGDARMQRVISNLDLSAENVVQRLRSEVAAHQRDMAQNDDITVVCVDRVHHCR